MSFDPKQAMQLAIQSALTGIQNQEGGPFGAAIVYNDTVIAVAHNTVLRDKDPTCHSEVNAIRKACQALDTHILEGAQLYSTAEPCPMCLAASYWARIEKIYVGVGKDVAANYGFDDSLFYEQLNKGPEQRNVPQNFGIMAKECEQVFEHWASLQGELY